MKEKHLLQVTCLLVYHSKILSVKETLLSFHIVLIYSE